MNTHAPSRSLNPARPSPLAVAALVAMFAAPVLIFLFPAVGAALEFDRRAVNAGHLWRLITCHWTHWSTDLLFWSDGTFALLVLACWRTAPGWWIGCVGASMLVVSLTVWIGTDLQSYRGLSGIDSALFVMLAMGAFRDAIVTREAARYGAIALLMLAFVAKLTFEVATGRPVFASGATSGMTPVPLAHLAGALCGALFVMGGGVPRDGARFRADARSIRVIGEGQNPA